MMMAMRTRLSFLFFVIVLQCFLVPRLHAVDVKLEMPNPVISGVVMTADLVVSDYENRVRNINLPKSENLTWETRRGSSTQMSIINGKRNQSETYTIIFRVDGQKPVNIPAVTVRFADGSEISTKPLTITPELPNENLKDEAYAEAQFDPPVIVPGEPTTLIYRLYLRQDRKRAIKTPSLTPPGNLLSLGERSESSNTTIDGEGTDWSVQTWRWPLTASQAGTFQAVGQQEWYRCREDLFRQLVAESKHQVAIKPAILTVTALPEQGRPNDFSGLIGPLTASAKIDRSRIATGEGTTLTISLHGHQVGLARRPSVDLPSSVQAYPKDDTVTDEVRSFTWDVVPSSAGSVTIPAISFPYFDPSTKNYRRTITEPITIEVIPGRQRALVVSGAIDSEKPQALTNVIPLPPPLRGSASVSPQKSLWYFCLFIAFGVGMSVGIVQRWRARPKRGPHRGRALKTAINNGKIDAIAEALFALRPHLSADQRKIADTLEKAIDTARFGGGDVGDIASIAAPLFEVP